MLYRFHAPKSRLLIIAALIAALILFRASSGPSADRHTLNLQSEREFWAGEFERIGARQAYALFKERYSQHHDGTAHTVSHLMGDLIYNYDGIDGIGICDEAFGFGCYHQFLSRAISDHGPEIVPRLGEHCSRYEKNSGACFHGIGHGLHEYYGAQQLTEPLKKCGSLGPQGTYSCEQGVFMDYNVPLVYNDAYMYAIPREVDLKHPYAPCDRGGVPDEFKGACYNSLPHLWFQIEGMSADAIGKLCFRADARFADDCFRGIAIDLPGTLSYDQRRIIEACNAMPAPDKARICMDASARILDVLGFDSCIVESALGKKSGACER